MARAAAAAAAALCCCMMLAVSVTATPGEPTHIPAHWKALHRAPAHFPVSFTIAVTHDGAALLQETCKAVSDPSSDSYGQYLSVTDIAKISGTYDNHAVVSAWLESVGATAVRSASGLDHVVATMSVADAERAFGVEMSVYAHEHLGRVVVRGATRPVLPAVVAGAVDIVLGISDFPMLSAMNRAGSAAGSGGRRHAMSPKYLSAMAKVSAARAAFSKANVASPDFVYYPTPSVEMAYVSDTTATLLLLQICPKTFDPANTTVPCSNTPYPVKAFKVQCVLDGVETPMPTTWADVEMHCSAGLLGTVCSYAVKVPHTFKEGDFVNCSVAAEFAQQTTSFVTLPWVNVTAANQRVMATPYITPSLLTDFYGLPAIDTPVAAATQAVIEFEGQFYKPSDTAAFYKEYSVPHTGTTTHHGPDPPIAGGEATLDIEWITAMAPSADTVFWYHAAPFHNQTDSFLLGWLLEYANTTTVPLVNSISYGAGESMFIKGFGEGYIPRCNLELIKLCTRGVTVVVAAGDAGATNDGHGAQSCAVEPDFPASSPWITTVSATFMTQQNPRSGAPDGRGESAVSIPGGLFWTTGGGFSNQATNFQPWYQKDLVQKYLSSAPAGTMPPAAMFNSSNRAYPDVSAIGHNVMCVTGGVTAPVDGTSAAAPIFAAMITRLNQARMAVGQPAIGFANPLLYSAYDFDPTIFYDVVGPANNRCGAFACCPHGYEVTPGYDAVTGLGTMGNFLALEAYALAN